MNSTDKPVTPERLMQFAWGYAPMLIIEAAVRHGLFDRLHQRAQSIPELAAATGASTRGLRAILNALVGLELLKREGECYALTPESAAFLVSSRPEYRGSFFHHHHRHLLPHWMQLAQIVRTGRPARAESCQSDSEEYFAGFVESLFPGNFAAAHALGEHLRLAQSAARVSVLDIGAGSGVWGIALAKLSAQVRVRAIDWPGVLTVTRRVVEREGVAGQFTTVAGDYFEADFGRNHHLATLGNILHGEGPDRNRRLLRKTFDALAPGGTVAIQEFIPNDDRTGPAQALLFAVNMLVNTESGDTYTFPEMSVWLREAGFVEPRLLETPAASPLLLANKPPA